MNTQFFLKKKTPSCRYQPEKKKDDFQKTKNCGIFRSGWEGAFF